jgi:hypothetical protein
MTTLAFNPVRARAFWVAMLALLIGTATTAIANGATMFPSVESQNLNGRSVKLPGEFKAPASIVFVAYVRGQQTQVDSWKTFVTGMRERFPAIGVFEVPTLSRGDALFRWFIDGGMRRGITDTATRESTITLYIDKKSFNDALGITSERDITVLLVEPNGAVLWRSAGTYAPEKSAGFTEAVAALGVGPA